MNNKEAYEILELQPNASPDDVKKKYKDLAKTWHPDINKAPEATEKFKKINEAYNQLTNPEEHDTSFNPFEGFGEAGFNPFRRQQVVQVEHINLHETISFKESVLGTKREVKFSRNGKCTKCNGAGQFQIHNGCLKCGGKGQIIAKQGNMVFARTCDACFGQHKVQNCEICSSTGRTENQVSFTVTIPGGVLEGNILRLSGAGHYIGNFMGMDQYAEAHLYISVTPESGLSLTNQDVICSLNISLLEALTGTLKSVNTIYGDREINIPSLSKNNNEIVLPKLGVNGVGSQKVILNVEYPDQDYIDSIVGILQSRNFIED